ncbi:NAD-P-binding protein [Russula aff. rugulosa BPL654]|nr:NAD-P-binding protein [Russula aff. rugulosa BPL654]
MSGYTKFAVVGAGRVGNCIVQELLKEKAAGTVKEVAILTRQGSNKTVQGDVKVIEVDYSNDESIKNALAGVDVVISAVAIAALDIQGKVAVAAKNADVKLFVPSEFGFITEGNTEGLHGIKAKFQGQLRALGLPYVAFYTGKFSDSGWSPAFYIDITSGKVSVGGDGNTQITFTSKPDVARYVSYVLTHLPPEQLENRSFAIAGDNKSFNEIFKVYEEKTGKKLQVTYIPLSELDARLAADPEDIVADLHKFWATAGPFPRTDNHLYPDWNPSSVIDNMPLA